MLASLRLNAGGGDSGFKVEPITNEAATMQEETGCSWLSQSSENLGILRRPEIGRPQTMARALNLVSTN